MRLINLNYDVFAKGFKLCCLFMAGYMIFLQALRYFENEDTSSIHYKKFNDSPQDIYPTFSICFEDKHYGIYRHGALLETLGFTRSEYVKTLMGENFPLNNATNVVTNVTTNPNILKSSHSHFRMDFKDLFEDFKTKALNHSEKITLKYDIGDKNVPFYVGYQDPVRICYTRKSFNEKGIILKVDQLWTKKIKILIARLSMLATFNIYLHYPGQLIRSFSKSIYERSFMWITRQNHYVSITPVLVSVLRKREDAYPRCNPNLIDEDKEIRRQIMHRVGCVPPYWKHLQSSDVLFPNCDKQSQMKQIFKTISQFNKVIETYHPPCNEMRIVSVVQWGTMSLPGVGISYMDEMYEEVVNHRDIGFEMFWSGIGGFIGMFLGFSLSQIPETFNNLVTLMKYK